MHAKTWLSSGKAADGLTTGAYGPVREDGKALRTLLAAFFNVPLRESGDGLKVFRWVNWIGKELGTWSGWEKFHPVNEIGAPDFYRLDIGGRTGLWSS